MNRTPIEWCRTYAADGSFEEGFSVNPVRFRPHGSAAANGKPARLLTMCQKISPGCKHCYAESITRRFWPKDAKYKVAHKFTMGTELVPVSFPGYTAEGVSSNAGEFVLDEKTLLSVLKRRQPAKVFWGDMTDLFGEWVTDAMLDRMMAVCALTPHLTHIFLTKRAERMPDYFMNISLYQRWLRAADELRARFPRLCSIPISDPLRFSLPNVWLGASTENQEQADKRRQPMLEIAARGWLTLLSCEPLLGALDLSGYLAVAWQCSGCRHYFSGGYRSICPNCQKDSYWTGSHAFNPKGGQVGAGLRWVIVGGESGNAPDIRPMHPVWAKRLLSQCLLADVPFFFKQHGEWARLASPPLPSRDRLWLGDAGEMRVHGQVATDVTMERVGKKAAGRLLDGREWNQFPEVCLG